MRKTFIRLGGAAGLALGCVSAFAQTMAYGPPVSLELAKTAAQAAAAEMRKHQFEMTIAVVDSGGNLVYLERSNQAGLGTIEPAIGKAKAANGIKTPTKVIADMILNQNRINLIAVPGAMPVEGGLPPDDDAVANVGAKGLHP